MPFDETMDIGEGVFHGEEETNNQNLETPEYLWQKEFITLGIGDFQPDEF